MNNYKSISSNGIAVKMALTFALALSAPLTPVHAQEEPMLPVATCVAADGLRDGQFFLSEIEVFAPTDEAPGIITFSTGKTEKPKRIYQTEFQRITGINGRLYYLVTALGIDIAPIDYEVHDISSLLIPVGKPVAIFITINGDQKQYYRCEVRKG